MPKEPVHRERHPNKSSSTMQQQKVQGSLYHTFFENINLCFSACTIHIVGKIRSTAQNVNKGQL